MRHTGIYYCLSVTLVIFVISYIFVYYSKNKKECHCDNSYKLITASLNLEKTKSGCSDDKYTVDEIVYSFFIECPSQVYVNKSLICQIQFLKPFDLLSDIDNKTVSINIKNLTEIKLNSFENTTFNITLKETGFAEISAIENYFNSSSISLVEVIKTPGKI